MFCSACGAKITNEKAKFCAKCGNRLRTQENTEPKTPGDDVSERRPVRSNTNTTSSDMTVNRSRSVSSSGSNYSANAALFELFRQLIEPVKAIELLEEKKNQNLAKLEELRETCLKLQDEHGPGMLKILFNPNIFDTLDDMRYAKDCKQDLKELSKEYDELVPKIEKENQNYSSQQQQILTAISSYICYVPPDYRSSSSLTIMVNDYDNCRVDNLKEAVLLCEQRQVHSQVMNQLTVIHYEMATRMDNIESALGTLQQETEFAAAASLSSAILSAGVLAFI